MKRYFIADLLTGSRIVWAVVLCVFTALSVKPAMWLVLATLLVLSTDALDGSAARKWPYPNDGKSRWWRRVQLDTPADLALGLSMVAYTLFVVDFAWGIGLLSAVPIALIALLVIWLVERKRPRATVLRNLRLAGYFTYLALILGVWTFTVSENPLAWLVVYGVAGIVVALLKKGRLVHGKGYNSRRDSQQ